MKLLLKIRYVGTHYCGFAVQTNGKTIQGLLCEAAERLFGRRCDITGCSRMDSGVHANEFYATLEAHDRGQLLNIPVDRVPRAMCSLLPHDIAVMGAMEVSGGFHPRYDVDYKEYIYKIWNRSERDPFLNNLAYHYPYQIGDSRLADMNEAAAYLEGTHDFCAFMAEGSSVKGTVRTVKYCVIERTGDLIILKIAADGFLYNMIRIIIGTLLDVAAGRILPGEIPSIIDSGNRKNAGSTAPACGLYLNRVVYKDPHLRIK